MKTLTCYKGMANATWLTLMRQGRDDPAMATVQANTMTRAMLSLGTYCVDTNTPEHSNMIAFNEDKTEVVLRLGMIGGLVPGSYHGRLTVYDASDQPLAWEEYMVEVKDWKVCPAGS